MSAFALKVFATVIMVIDHVAEFIPELPIWFHWIGRLSSPIFLFLCGWSCEYTHNRKSYVARLYIASVLMSIPQGLLGISNNIFTTLFHTALIISLLKADRNIIRIRNIALYITYQIILAAILLSDFSMPLYENVPPVVNTVLLTMLASWSVIEGGIIYVIIGVALWATRNHAIIMSVVYIGINAVWSVLLSSWGARALTGIEHSILLSFPSEVLMQDNSVAMEPIMLIHWILELFGIDFMNMGNSPFTYNYAWMMIFALPFMLAYNQQRGRSVKWFFYWFYPAHILLLFALGTALGFEPMM